MFTSQPIGFVSSPYKDASEVPKGLGAKHEADGVLKILPEFEAGLTDIEGFSHLVVIWEFDRSHGFDLLGRPPSDHRSHGVFATRSPRRPNPIGLSTVELRRRGRYRAACSRHRYAGWDTYSRYQTLPVQHPVGKATPWLAGRSGGATEGMTFQRAPLLRRADQALVPSSRPSLH